MNYFRKKGYQSVALSCHIKEADVNLFGELDAWEWANVFQYGSFCVTERFHPIIFCLRYGTPFLAVDQSEIYQKYESKTSFLLRNIGIQKHHINLKSEGWDKVLNKLDTLTAKNEGDELIWKFREQRDAALKGLLKAVDIFN
jgi:polysaccharide pyruvyl transferase WcaK-like protein